MAALSGLVFTPPRVSWPQRIEAHCFITGFSLICLSETRSSYTEERMSISGGRWIKGAEGSQLAHFCDANNHLCGSQLLLWGERTHGESHSRVMPHPPFAAQTPPCI